MKDILSKYEPVIGLEIHAQMSTVSKAFCQCSTKFDAPANTNVCPVCLGHPGTLPVLNHQLVESILKMGLSCNCSIRERSIFARKNYFYPDLSKGYQITQFETPICYDGFINIQLKENSKRIGITRIHMEEDAGKSIHDFHDNETLVDFNRCGVPLIEIVSEPDIRSTDEASSYLSQIRQMLMYLGINDGSMEEGSLRCDANISIRLRGENIFGTRTEIKNLNSFRNVTDAINAEIRRQASVIESGEKVFFTTMTFNAKEKTTSATRTKEQAHDYRYFPEPDLVYVHITEDWIKLIEESLPEFGFEKQLRFKKDYSLPVYDAGVLTSEKETADFFEASAKILKSNDYKTLSNLVLGEILKITNDKKVRISQTNVSPKQLAIIVDYLSEGKINLNSAKDVINEMSEKGIPAEDIIKSKNLIQVSDEDEIVNIIKNVLKENKTETERYRSGETKLLGVLVGKVMRASSGKANPKIVNKILLEQLEKADA